MKIAIDNLFAENSLFFIICGEKSKIKNMAGILEKLLLKCGKNVLNLCCNAEIKEDEVYNAVIMRECEKPVCSCKSENTILICLPDYKKECLGENCYSKAVVPYCNANKSDCVFTYSDKYDDADMVAKNIREVDGKTMFELLTMDFIGRVRADSSLSVGTLELLSVLGGLICAGIDKNAVVQGVCSL